MPLFCLLLLTLSASLPDQDAEAEQAARGEASELHVIIFDEIDAICKARGSVQSGSGVHDTLVNQLLTKIDGVDALNNILLIGMTNRCAGCLIRLCSGVLLARSTFQSNDTCYCISFATCMLTIHATCLLHVAADACTSVACRYAISPAVMLPDQEGHAGRGAAAAGAAGGACGDRAAGRAGAAADPEGTPSACMHADEKAACFVRCTVVLFGVALLSHAHARCMRRSTRGR